MAEELSVTILNILAGDVMESRQKYGLARGVKKTNNSKKFQAWTFFRLLKRLDNHQEKLSQNKVIINHYLYDILNKKMGRLGEL